MAADQLLTNILSIIILLGGPILPLLWLAKAIGHWHAEHPDPPEVEQAESGGH